MARDGDINRAKQFWNKNKESMELFDIEFWESLTLNGNVTLIFFIVKHYIGVDEWDENMKRESIAPTKYNPEEQDRM